MNDIEYLINNFRKRFNGPEYERVFMNYRSGLIILDEAIEALIDIEKENIIKSFKGV